MWKTIEEFTDFEVSDEGLIRRTIAKPFHPARLLEGWTDKRGYSYVGLWQGGKHKSARVHVLVARAFIPNPHALPTVNHKDGIKAHNYDSNLEWATNTRQAIHAVQTGLHKTKGYSFRPNIGKWHAYITRNDVQHYCGLHNTEAQAIAARKAAEKIYHNLEDIQ
jgi:hypothetical protein